MKIYVDAFSCAVLTATFNSWITCDGFSAPNIAVPATITLLPIKNLRGKG